MDPPAKLGNEHCCRLLFVVLFLQGAIITVSGSDEGMTSTRLVNDVTLLSVVVCCIVSARSHHNSVGIRRRHEKYKVG